MTAAAVLTAQPAVGQPSAAGPPSAATVVPPRLVAGGDATFPTDEAPREVTVTVEITVGLDGRASAPEVVSSGGSAFDRAALDAVPMLRFEPATSGGEDVAARIRYAFHFTPPAAPAGTEPSPPAPPPPDHRRTQEAAESEPLAPEVYELDEEPPEEGYGATAEVAAPPREVTRRSVSEDRVTRIPGTRGDPLRSIEVMPGVGRTSMMDGAPRLRGSMATDSVALIEDGTVPLLYHFGGLTSVVHPRLIRRVDLYPGNFSVRHGRITGGVVEARLGDPRTDGVHGVADLNVIDSSLLIEAPIGEDLAFAVAGRRSNIDLFFDAFTPEDSYSVVAAPVYYDFQALATARLGDHTLRFFGYGSSDALELQLAQPSEGDPRYAGTVDIAVAFYRARLALESALGDGVTQELLATYGIAQGTQNIGPTTADFLTHVLRARGEWQTPLSDQLRLTFGVDFAGSFMVGDYAGPRPPQLEGDPTSDDPDAARNRVVVGEDELDGTIGAINPAAYVELAYRPTDQWLLIGGGRGDYFSAIDEVGVDPRFATRCRLSDEMTLKGGVGLFTQPPIYWESMPILGNEELDPTRAVHSSLGVEQRLFDRIEVGVEGFHKYLFDRVVATRGGTPPHFVNDGNGHVCGLEVSLEAQPIDELFAYLAYTISRSERSDRGEPTRRFDEDETHSLSVAAGYDIGAGWSAGARFRLVSGHPDTPIPGSVYDATTGVYKPRYGGLNSTRTRPFTSSPIS